MEIAHTADYTEYLLKDCTEVETALGAVDSYLRSQPHRVDAEIELCNRLFQAALRMGHSQERPTPERLSSADAELCVRALRWSVRPRHKRTRDPFLDISTDLLGALEGLPG